VRRYWVPRESVSGDRVVLRGDILHHIRDVCRLHQGAKFEVILTGAPGDSSADAIGGKAGGVAHLVEIISESKQDSIAKILETRELPALPRPAIHLAMSIPRFPVFEAVVEKAVELGVTSIRPFFSDFSFIRTQSDIFDKKRARFEKIVMSATQQSGRGDLMTIGEPLDLAKLLQGFNPTGAARGLFAYEGTGDDLVDARNALSQMRGPMNGSMNGPMNGPMNGIGGETPPDVWLFVGSEGGFSDREVQLFQSVGLKPVTLGSQVLRVETACVALLSIIKYDFDLMR
jgi:16S rRNA (uracil1498-N3)-methyltransferase